MQRSSFTTRLRFSYSATLLNAARSALRNRLWGRVRFTGNGRIAASSLSQADAPPKSLVTTS